MDRNDCLASRGHSPDQVIRGLNFRLRSEYSHSLSLPDKSFPFMGDSKSYGLSNVSRDTKMEAPMPCRRPSKEGAVTKASDTK